MKKLLIIFMFYLALSLFSVRAEEELVLKIEASKTEYLLGEPIVLYLSLQNTSDEVRELPVVLAPIAGYVDYQIKFPDSFEKSFESSVIGDLVNPMTAVAPGEQIIGEAKLFYGANGWTFEQPGTYEITARMFRSSLSSTVTITVHAPIDESTANAAQLFLESEDVGFVLLYGGGDILGAIQRLEQVSTEYPNTPHATYANQVLGSRLINDFNDLATGNVRLADPTSALPFLEKAKQKPISFYDILHTHMSLYEAYTKLNNTVKAQSALKDLVQMVSTQPQWVAFLPFIESMFDKMGIPMPELTQTVCLLYAVSDPAPKENQLFSVDLSVEDFEVKPLGITPLNHDISLATADFDGDGEDEIALGAKEGGHTVTLYKLDGSEIRSFPVSASGMSLAAGNLEGDEQPEIIVASRAANRKSVLVYTADGTALDPISGFAHNTRMMPTVGDVDGDQKTDLIAGRLLKEDQVAIYNVAKQELNHFAVFSSSAPKQGKGKAKGMTYGVNVASGDFDNDGKAEIVAAQASKGSQIEVYSSTGELLNSFAAFDSQKGVIVTVGNMLDDGQPEIVVGEAKSNLIRGFNRNGEQLFEFQAAKSGIISSLATFRCPEPENEN